MKKYQCPQCRNRSLAEVVLAEYKTELDHDGRAYTLTMREVPVLNCSECGSQALTRAASDMATVALREAAGLLSPEKIRAGRTQLRLTQKELAKHLDLAESTLSRWETGAQIQQRCMDTLLRLFFEVPEVRLHLGVPAATVDPASPVETPSPVVSA